MKGEGTLFFLVTHRRTTKQITTGYRLYPHEWDDAEGRIMLTAVRDGTRSVYLAKLNSKLESDNATLRGIIERLEATGKYTVADVVRLFKQQPGSHGIVAFANRLVSELTLAGKERTAERYATVVNSFRRFVGIKGDIALGQVDGHLITEYEAYLKNQGLCLNSSSFYMRGLRAIYNRAVEQGLTTQRTPFRYVYTGIERTVKRAVTLATIRRLRNMNLAGEPALDYARDIFMFSFYTRGMSFIDMAYLRKSDLQNGILSYRRHKTGQRLAVKWERPMQTIIDKYRTDNTPYLLPIIKTVGEDERRQYKSAVHTVNNRLKVLGTRLGLDRPLTTYVARHGWASIAWSKNIPIATISKAMGHDSEATTRIYLASLDTSAIDKANNLIINSL